MTDPLVTIRNYADEPSALLAQATLRASGIDSSVRSDGASGFEPWLSFASGYRLVVRREDAEAAREYLEEG